MVAEGQQQTLLQNRGMEMSKVGHITIEVPLPDEGTLEDLETLGKHIANNALTQIPGQFGKVYGKVIHWGWHKPDKRYTSG